MRVLIIGGGLGGLALAAGLRLRNVDVTVYERDTDLAATGGYHITLDPRAQHALADLLPDVAMRRIRASAALAGRRDADVMWDWRGRQLAVLRGVVHPDAIDIDRITLRLILAEVVGDDLRTGRTCIGIETEEAAVTASFDDGSTVTGDILVGADGAHSLVTRRLAGESPSHPTGLVGTSGRTRIDDLSASERGRLGTRSSFAIGPRGTALYAGYLDPAGHAALDDPAESRAVTREPSFIWGAMFPETATTAGWRNLDGARIRDASISLLHKRGWDRRTLELLERTAPESVAVYRFNAAASDPSLLAPWAPGRVTALGDAVHSTPPTAGMGAGIAIRDAEHLVRALGEVRSGRALPDAIGGFERGMALRGAEAITLAMKTVRQVLSTDSALGSTLLRAAAPPMAALQRLRR
ncbi:FAD-dependent oxidoreductase [Microbacterium kunmingense]|uniref:FAD-dependent oxidoreductase n=1 Tax=Microbacterium kunmingense TaxID=2915939 RepID=UPI003D728A7E